MNLSCENRALREKKILLVDDEPLNIKVMSQILRETYRLMVATGGHEALKCAASPQPPDLILLDLIMPGMDGVEVCRQLKASETTADIPVIVVTGKAEEDEITEAMQAGAADFIRKPVHPEVLKVRVANQLAIRRCRSRGSQGHDIIAAALQQEKEANRVLRSALRSAQEELESSRRYRHMFLAEMHHEIKTHLTTIVGMSGLALRQELSPGVRDYMLTIQRATDTLVELINDIVDLSLLEEGEIEVEEQEFTPSVLINDVCDACAELALKKDVELVMDISSGLPALLSGSSTRLRQLLTHLLHFNIKWLGGREILLNAEGHFEKNGVFVLECAISCMDSNLTDHEARSLLACINPQDNNGEQPPVGTGLGLPICRRIVHNMSGRISVSTSADSGVTFSCSIPFECVEKQPVPMRLSPRLTQGLNILLADDSRLAAQVTADMLIAAGCRVESVHGWEQVLERFSSPDSQAKRPDDTGAFDLIVLDWKMPGMNGIDILKRLRNQGIQTPAIIMGLPALLMMSMVHEACLNSDDNVQGSAGFIMKPVKREALLEKIHDLLSCDSGQAGNLSCTYTEKTDTDLSGVRVLLVEDNAINRQIVRQLLEMAGMEVRGAATGNAAVDAAAHNVFDVILMDIELPDINGMEAAGLIRGIPSCSGIPVIALTAHSWTSHRKAYQKAGMKYCIEKPVDPDELYAIIKEAVFS